jgi:hypothetical protein
MPILSPALNLFTEKSFRVLKWLRFCKLTMLALRMKIR